MVKVLIVDDSLESRMILGKIIRKSFNVTIYEAEDGNVALEKIQKLDPDIVFLDYEMPSLNGKEMLKKIRSGRAHRNLPIVIVSSHSEPDLVKELVSYNILAYLVKPLSSDYVIKLLSVVFPKFTDKPQ
jgi:YesN/AraC family two-component response regulator